MAYLLWICFSYVLGSVPGPGFCDQRSTWVDTDPGSRPGRTLTDQPPPRNRLRRRPLGARASFRRLLFAAHQPEVPVLWRKLTLSGSRGCGGREAWPGNDDSGDYGFQQPREAAAGPLLPAFRECGPPSSRPFRAPRVPVPWRRPRRAQSAGHLGLPRGA